jgi:hypothetical protein
MKLQNVLLSGLNQINTARNQATQDKSRARSTLLSDVRSQIYNLNVQQQQYQQSLQQWKEQRSAALSPYLNEKYVSDFVANIAKLQQQYSGSGLALSGSVEPSQTGGTGSYAIQPKKTTEDDLYEKLISQ